MKEVVSPESALWSVICGQDGLLLIDWADGTRRETSWFPVDEPERWERMLAEHKAAGRDPRISLVPRRDRHLDNVGPSSVLWCRGETGDSWSRLRRFTPKPTLVLRDGQTCRYTALWWLESPLPMTADPSTDWLIRANRRLAQALAGRMGASDPEWLMPYGLSVLADADPSRVYTAKRVVGKLADRPKRVRQFPQAA